MLHLVLRLRVSRLDGTTSDLPDPLLPLRQLNSPVKFYLSHVSRFHRSFQSVRSFWHQTYARLGRRDVPFFSTIISLISSSLR